MAELPEIPAEPALKIAAGFAFGQASPLALLKAPPPQPPTPPLGPLTAFTGTFKGNGFNTIFRPHKPGTPTGLPVDDQGTDNVLELNLTAETLSFSSPLGTVPNRGMVQLDLFLNGVPYLQSVNDVTDAQHPVGIHLEPGIWLCVGQTTDPALGQTFTRMASIPHGTTINAQGTAATAAGKPTIPPVDITPFLAGNPANKIHFPSQVAATGGTPRIPQDLGPFITAGTITQAMLDDPNSVLRTAIAAQTITSTTTISVSTSPASPIFGGGSDNIAFLLGDPGALVNPSPAGQNAQTLMMAATFWIETVQHKIVIPPFKLGQPPLKIPAPVGPAGHPVPVFEARPPAELTAPRTITVSFTQIQYSQLVVLNFNGLSWPHVSVATLVPGDPLPVPPGAWA